MYNVQVEKILRPYYRPMLYARRLKKPFESRNFLVLCSVLLKFNISAQLIEGFPNVYGSWNSAEEKLSIPLEAHDFLETRNFLVFLPAEPTRCLDFGKTTGKIMG